jgi:DNA polymerase-3 subunit alpha
MYVNCKSWFSYRYGTFSTEQLVQTAQALGVQAMALTNINTTADAWEFTMLCRKAGIKPVLGCEIRNARCFCYILLAKNQAGFLWINRFLSEHKRRNLPFPARPDTGGDVWTIYELGSKAPADLGENELIGVAPSKLNKLYYEPVDQFPDKYIICQPVTFQDRQHFHLHRLLRGIDLNTLVSKLSPADIADPEETFLSPEELIKRFGLYPAMIVRTRELLECCGIETVLYDPGAHTVTDKNKKIFTESLDEDRQLLRKLAFENIPQRYSHPDQEVVDRVEKELAVIDKLGFNAYYLIVWDIIQYAIKRNFFYVGRGSGANSIVAFLLRITDVEPIRFDLYFERFLNQFRSSPPDFDIDFSHKDRDEVIKYVFDRYGAQHVALLGMQSTFKGRASLRELGKVLGLPKAEIDRLATDRGAMFGEDRIQRTIRKYGRLMQGLPNHHSIHAGGILISEKPICTYTALELPSKGFATSQIDMFEAERIGLFKLDILSQRGLGHIKDTIRLVKENRGIDIDITDVERFMKDPRVNDKIRKGDTIGCFYVESPAMRQLLMKLGCGDYLTLVAASSIIRPGVAQSGMMKQYIRNYRHPHRVKYLHPRMEDLLKETFGVMVYQEDVIKVAHHYGGLDRAESDILRRVMSGKYKGSREMHILEEKFFANCHEKGYPEPVSREVWRQIASFSGFSFSKAHSASFAVESYQSLYLKTYFPKEFMVAVINNFGGFYRTPFYFHELRKAGARLHAPCVNHSSIYTNISGGDVYVGLIHVEKLTDHLKDRIVAERKMNGVYTGLQDFVERVQPAQEQLNTLVRIGALRFTGIPKKELLWKANFLQKRAKEYPVASSLFHESEPGFELPSLTRYPLEDAFDEIELIGFSLGEAFDLVDDDLAGITCASDLYHMAGKEVDIAGRLVCTKDSRTKKGELMLFGTFLDPRGDWLDTVHWPDSLERYPFLGDGFYRMKGKVVEEFGVYSVEVFEMKKIGLKKTYPGENRVEEPFRRQRPVSRTF